MATRRTDTSPKPAKPVKPAKPAKAKALVSAGSAEGDALVDDGSDDEDDDAGAAKVVAPVEVVDDDADEDEDDLDAFAGKGPVIDVDGDDDGEVVDVGTPGLVKAKRITLAGDPGAQWVPDAAEEAETNDDDLQKTVKEVGGGRDAIYNSFVRQATRVQRLTEEEERALGLRVRDEGDKEAAKKLVVHNLRLAIKMAHQYRRSWTNIMDLVQEASAGMAIAGQRWDPDQGTRFGTYAVYWIRAQLTKFLMTNGRAIHTGNTRAGRKLYFQLPRVRRKLLAEGKEATIAEIAAEVHETPEEVARIVARLDGREASLDAQVGNDDDGSTLGEMIAGDDRGPEENAAENEVGNVLKTLMERFKETLENDRDRAIWTEHLVAHEPRSLVELGARYGVSKQRMGQLATRIKRSFRRHIIDELGPDTQLHWLFAQDS